MHDTVGKGAILFLDVKCTNMAGGTLCDWTGPLGMLTVHLCKFDLVPCEKRCKDEEGRVQEFLRKDLREHLLKDCPYRDFKCEICGATGTYTNIVHTGEVCLTKSCECPSVGCTQVVERQNIARHLTTCEYHLVPCKYMNIGCEAKLELVDISKHEKENEETHLCVALHKVMELQGRNAMLKSSKVQLVQTVAELNDGIQSGDRYISQLKQSTAMEIDRLDKKCKARSATLSWIQTHIIQAGDMMTDKCIFKITNVSRRTVFTCEPFYTVPGHQSYHMVVKVHLRGEDPNYISAYVSLVDGKFDRQLSWPFCGQICCTLLNQRLDGRHLRMSLLMTADEDMRVGSPPDLCGSSRFISHQDLRKESDTIQYLVNDTLYFQITIMYENGGILTCSI